MSRVEKELATTLFRQSATGLEPTAEGMRPRHKLSESANAIRAIYRQAGQLALADVIEHAVSLTSLFRFANVMETGSIRKSARLLQIGQPQLKRMISDPEKSLCANLFIRSREGLRPSEVARRIAANWVSSCGPARFTKMLK